MTKKVYYEPLYKIWIHAFVEADPKKAQSIAEHIIDESLDILHFKGQAKTIDYIHDSGGQRILVWLKKPEAHLLAHELLHVIDFAFDARRIPFDSHGIEHIAYLMEHLFDEFWPLVSPLNKVLPKASIHAMSQAISTYIRFVCRWAWWVALPHLIFRLWYRRS